MQRPYVVIVVLFVVAYVVTVLATGEPLFLIPALILGLVILAYAGINRWLTRKQLARHDGDTEGVMADGDDPYPAVPPFGDDDRPAGDTPEAHDEINPHDVPKWDRAARAAAEEQAAGPGGTTTGNRSA
jgi:hypothetical protein